MFKRDETGSDPGLWPKVGAVVSGALYAGLLTTRLGRRIEREHTWFAVMGGVFVTLGWLAAEDKRSSERSFTYFVCTGLPIMARAVYLYSQFTDDIIERELYRGNETEEMAD